MPGLAHSGRAPIICFGGEDWGYHHPHSRYHILKRLCRDRTVLFVNSLSLGFPKIGTPFLRARLLAKVRRYLPPVLRSPEGVYVTNPLVWPRYDVAAARSASWQLLRWQMRVLMRLLRIRDPVLWISIPTALGVVGYLHERLVVYQISDRYGAETIPRHMDRELVMEMHGRLRREADLVLCSGARLYETERVFRRSAILFQHGLDFDLFASTLGARHPRPPDLAPIGEPILGYWGSVDGFAIDLDLIRYARETHPEWNWVFLGRVSEDLASWKMKGVHLLGPKPYEKLPTYAAHFDVCVLPWVQTNEFVAHRNPIKVREYLATGKPVVSTQIHEFKDWGHLIHLAGSAREFVRKVELALEGDTEDKRWLRVEAVRGDTWDLRAVELDQLIQAGLMGRT